MHRRWSPRTRTSREDSKQNIDEGLLLLECVCRCAESAGLEINIGLGESPEEILHTRLIDALGYREETADAPEAGAGNLHHLLGSPRTLVQRCPNSDELCDGPEEYRPHPRCGFTRTLANAEEGKHRSGIPGSNQIENVPDVLFRRRQHESEDILRRDGSAMRAKTELA